MLSGSYLVSILYVYIEVILNPGKLIGKSISTVTVICRNSDGLPLFPVFNQKTKTYAEIAQILNDYFLTLWGMLAFTLNFAVTKLDLSEHTQEGSTKIPWDDIHKHPDCYYDSWVHPFPCGLSSSDDMDELELTQTAMHLANTATAPPFSFYGRDEVSKNIKSMKAVLDNTDVPRVEAKNISVDSDVPVVEPSTVTSPYLAPTPPRALTSFNLPAPPTPPEPLCDPTPKSPIPLPPVPPDSASQQINNPTLSKAPGENTDSTVQPPKTGTKRKSHGAKLSKITVPDVPGTSTTVTRRGARSRKLAANGPVLVVDPALPAPFFFFYFFIFIYFIFIFIFFFIFFFFFIYFYFFFYFFFFFKSGPCAPIYYAVLEHNPRATLLVTSVLH